MTSNDTGDSVQPLRIAIIGSGPAAFYTVAHLRKQKELVVDVDIFERLPTPFGLVRAGVAPDHQKDKSVTRAFEKSALAEDPRVNFRFFGNVEFGQHLDLQDLADHYHQIVFCTGAPVDRELGIPGESLPGIYSATDFVAWYNGHPYFSRRHFDLGGPDALVIGLGNVALDVVRMLARTHAELLKTDMADHALDALKDSAVRSITQLGRRGPGQAAFTAPEVAELANIDDLSIHVDQEMVTPDQVSAAWLAEHPDRNTERMLQALRELAEVAHSRKISSAGPTTGKQFRFAFLRTPLEFIESNERVGGLRCAVNRMERGSDGRVVLVATGEEEIVPANVVFRSTGYRGVALAGVPFDEHTATIRNASGRVIDDAGAVRGLYTAGWIKRGPTGVIGTNKTDAQETVQCMLQDLADGQFLQPTDTDPEAVARLIAQRQPRHVRFDQWQTLDELERGRGELAGRPRVKMTDVEEMLNELAL